MLLFAISIVLVFVLFILFGFNYKTQKWRINAKQVLSILGLIPMLVGLFVMVPANRVGVLFDPLSGGIQDSLLQEGLQVKAPYQDVFKLSTEVTEITFDNISVQTSDSHWVKTTLQVQASIDKDRAFDYFKKYRDQKLSEIGSILKSTTQKELEMISTSYNIYELLGGERKNIVEQTQRALKEEFIKDGIIIHRLILVDTDAGDDIEASIAKEATLEKEAEAAEHLITKATAEGEAKVIAAEKEKKANELLAESLTREILEKLKIDLYMEKWDGKLPQVVSGDASGLIIDISE